MQPPRDLLVGPSVFTHPAGAAHWNWLLRARAVENPCYVLAPTQRGRHENGHRSRGHSLLADPWAEVLACQPEGEAVVVGTLDRDRRAAVLQQFPRWRTGGFELAGAARATLVIFVLTNRQRSSSLGAWREQSPGR